MSKTFRRSDGYRKHDWRNKKVKKHFKKMQKDKFRKNNSIRIDQDENNQIYNQEFE